MGRSSLPSAVSCLSKVPQRDHAFGDQLVDMVIAGLVDGAVISVVSCSRGHLEIAQEFWSPFRPTVLAPLEMPCANMSLPASSSDIHVLCGGDSRSVIVFSSTVVSQRSSRKATKHNGGGGADGGDSGADSDSGSDWGFRDSSRLWREVGAPLRLPQWPVDGVVTRDGGWLVGKEDESVTNPPAKGHSSHSGANNSNQQPTSVTIMLLHDSCLYAIETRDISSQPHLVSSSVSQHAKSEARSTGLNRNLNVNTSTDGVNELKLDGGQRGGSASAN